MSTYTLQALRHKAELDGLKDSEKAEWYKRHSVIGDLEFMLRDDSRVPCYLNFEVDTLRLSVLAVMAKGKKPTPAHKVELGRLRTACRVWAATYDQYDPRQVRVLKVREYLARRLARRQRETAAA